MRSASAFFDTLPKVDTGKSLTTSSRSGSLNLAISLRLQERDQFLQRQRPARAQDHAGAHLLAHRRVGHRHAGHVLHRRVHQDQVLDLLGADLLAAAVDQVLLAALDDVVARRMLAHQVARAIEAVGRELARVVLGHAVVAAQRVRAAARQFADFAVGHFAAVVVDQLAPRRRRRPAGRRSPAARLRSRPGARTSACLRDMPKFSCTNALRNELARAQPHLGLHALAAALDQLHRDEVEAARSPGR